MGDNSDKKKNMGHLFFHEESIYEIPNISINGSKVMLCTRKRDKRMNKQTEKPEAICPPTFSKLGT